MGRAAQIWAALSDSERADFALETAHLPQAFELLRALDEAAAELAGPAEGDPMPVFVIKGKDVLAPDAIAAYQNACAARGLNEQARQVWLALGEVAGWQSRHPDLVKLPDHPHVPAGVNPCT